MDYVGRDAVTYQERFSPCKAGALRDNRDRAFRAIL